jgi:amidohydrolase family protein
MPARRSMTKRIVLGFAIVGMSTLLAQPPRREGDPVLFEGARLITGDGGAAIERSGTEHVELEHMVSAGLTPSDAIVAATRTAADILRLDRLGTIAPGKSADFLVLDPNPLDSIANTRRIARVYMRGAEIPRLTAGGGGRSR